MLVIIKLVVNDLDYILCCLDQRSTLDQVLDSVRLLTPQCPGLCDVIEQLLMQDPTFHRSLIQLLLKQDCPCVVTTLPTINMGVVGVMPILYDGPDNDPEKWSKDYKRPEPFFVPPYMCGELGMGPLHIPLDSNAFDPYEEVTLCVCMVICQLNCITQVVVCKAHLTSDATDQVVSSCGSEESQEHDSMASSSDETDGTEKFLGNNVIVCCAVVLGLLIRSYSTPNDMGSCSVT